MPGILTAENMRLLLADLLMRTGAGAIDHAARLACPECGGTMDAHHDAEDGTPCLVAEVEGDRRAA